MDAFDTVVERRIAEAREAGLFDDLPGRGRPIADLHHQRPPGWWGMREMRAARDAGRAERLRGEVRDLVARAWKLDDEEVVRGMIVDLNSRIAAHAEVAEGAPVAPLDVETLLGRWRRRRG